MIITTADLHRLRWFRAATPGIGTSDLWDALQCATYVDANDVPDDVVTLNSRVRVADEELAKRRYTVVLPADAHAITHRISVLSPMGSALLGRRVGDEVRWTAPAGLRRARIVELEYQPEADARAKRTRAAACADLPRAGLVDEPSH